MFTIEEINLLLEIVEVFQKEMENTNPEELDYYEEEMAMADTIMEKLNKMYEKLADNNEEE